MAAMSETMPVSLQLLCFLLGFTVVHSAKLNVPKVLLPYYSSVATNFTLEVSEGCYTWKSSRPEIVAISPLGNPGTMSCSQQAVVTAVSKTPSRMSSIIIAEDPVSGQKINCDVIVDVIYSIFLETTTRELYLEDSPEQFILKAQDNEGNVFSTLEGLPFDWSLIADTDVEQEIIVGAHNVLRILPYGESPYETPAYIDALEAQGKQGNTILVEGIRTGTAKVSAKLADAAYKRVEETIVRLIVIANILLNPQVVYLMAHAQVQYKVELLKQGKIIEIPMPSDQYYLELKDPTLCSLDTKTSTVTAAEQYGYTEIELKDKNIKVKETFRQPSAGIYVVTPGYLGFVVFPGRKWVLEAERDYEIYIEIYDKDSRKIHPSNNIRVIPTIDKEYFQVYSSSLNGTYHTVKTLKKGNTVIWGQLKAVIAQDGTEFSVNPVIKNHQDVEIYDPVQVRPPFVYFPWDPVMRTNYHYQLQAEGGSGNYTWSSSETSVSSVNVRGEITTFQIGKAIVTAADVRNSAHFGTSEVHVLPPSEMEFIASRVEAEIGTSLELPLAVYGAVSKGGKKMFSDCRSLPLKVSLEDGNIFGHVDAQVSLVEGSCTTIKVNALSLGHTVIKVTYEGTNFRLQAKLTIAAYKPLKPIDPSEIAVVAVGASKEVIFEGGPQPWILNPHKYYQQLSAENPDIIKLTHIKGFGSQKNFHVFHVLCHELGEQSLGVTVGNEPTSKNKFPASATSSVGFACAQPVGLQLTPQVSKPEGLPACPIVPNSNEAVAVPGYQNLDILVTMTDSQGRRFDNFSSLAVEWEISNENIATLIPDMKTEITTADSGRKLMQTLKEVNLNNKLGTLSVTGTVKQYHRSYFKKEKITFEESVVPPISCTLDLMVVHDARIVPDQISVFNHPSNKAVLEIQGGSGHFQLDYGESSIAEVRYNAKTREIQVTPRKDGSFTITAYDLCLEIPEHAQSQVYISGVHVISVKVVDKVELHKEIVANVTVLDKKDRKLLASYFPLMNLKPQQGADIISVRAANGKSEDPFVAQYIVHGAALGRTGLQFTAKPPAGNTISSYPREIQVFPPLRLEPRNITIIVGALFQVTAYGGPQPQSSIEYTIENSNVAEISSSGLVDARETTELGLTTVTGYAVGYDSETGKRIVYSQDQVTVHVVQLTGIRIFAPLKRLQTGTQMPLYAMGMNEHETPFTFGSSHPALKFTWSVNNKEAVHLNSVYYKSGLKIPDQNNFAVQLFAEQAGHVTVSLKVSAAPGYQIISDARLYDDVQIQVFEKMHLTNPETCDGFLIMTPNTETQVKTSRDGTARMTYHVLYDNPDSSTSVVMVTEMGQLISGSHSGVATLVITAHEDFGVNQTIIIQIKVKPVSYLMLRADSVIRTTESALAAVPVGTVMHFTVTYHDDVGEQFFATNTHLRFQPSRYDLVHISPGSENHTLVARTTSIGQTILKVWDQNNPSMADYINLKVGQAILPGSNQLTLGDVVCFSSPVLTKQGHWGTWASTTEAISFEKPRGIGQWGHWGSSQPVVQIDTSLGVGVATQIGTSVIQYHVSDDLVTHSEISIIPVSKVHLRNEHVQYLSNVASRNRASTLTVTLDDGRSNLKSNVLGVGCKEYIAKEGVTVPYIPFRCELSMSTPHPLVDISDLLQVHAEFDSSAGQYVCRVRQVSGVELASMVSGLDTYVQLRAIVQARDKQPEVSSEVVSLPFLPGFYVQTSELTLSNLLPLGSLRLSAMERVAQDLKVASSDSSLVEVLGPERDAQADHVIHYPVRLLDRPALWELQDKLDVTIEIKCVATGQQQLIPVRIKLVGPRPEHGSGFVHSDSGESTRTHFFRMISSNYANFILVLLLIVVAICAMFVAWQAILGARYQQQASAGQASAFLNQSGGTASAYSPSPWNSPYSTGTSPSKVRLWTSGYDPLNTSPGAIRQRNMNNSRSSPLH